jgi:hypothetical protein
MTIPADTTPPPMTLAELDEIARRANRATPGPWEQGTPGLSDTYVYREFKEHEVCEGRSVTGWTNGFYVRSLADAEFIAHARTDVPQLIALARQALRDRTPAPPPDADDATRLAAELRQASKAWRDLALKGAEGKRLMFKTPVAQSIVGSADV